MSDDAATGASEYQPRGPEEAPRQAKSLTIGAVCKALQQEFPDISISKIRYLEDQKLLSPRRTPGGYRLYSAADVSRLRTILRLQRDEFLPLRGDPPGAGGGAHVRGGARSRSRRRATAPARPDGRPGAALRRITFSLRDRGALYSLEDVVEETGAEPRLIAELEDYGIVKGEVARRHALLRRDRARDRARGHRARALRRGGAQPARVPDLGRARGGAAAADPRPVAALAEPGAAQGGRRGAREPRRGRVAPEAPAARARPAPHREVSPWTCAALIRDIPDFPKPGIVFKDITPLLLDRGAGLAVDALAAWARPRDVDLVVAAEARGFILGAALARELGVGFVPARKPGKLPAETVSAEYILEYGVDALEVHADALRDGARVLVHDDLLATGGTARALAELAESAGAVVAGCAFLVELAFLGGRERLARYRRPRARRVRRRVTPREQRSSGAGASPGPGRRRCRARGRAAARRARRLRRRRLAAGRARGRGAAAERAAGRARERLLAVAEVRDDRASRVLRCRGKSLPRPAGPARGRLRVRARRGRRPRRRGRRCWRCCRPDGGGIAVVPFGGGTSVVGGLAGLRGPRRARLARPRAAGPRARRRRALADRGFEPGIRLPEADARAARARADARPRAAVVRVGERRRLRRHALGRPGLDRARADRRATWSALELVTPAGALAHARRRRAPPRGRRCASWWSAPRARSA